MRKPGFTFLEMLIATSLFVAGMVSVLGVIPLNRRYLTQSANTTQAADLAQEEVETVRNQPYSSLTVGSYEALHAVGSGSSDPLNIYQRQTTISYIDSQNNWAASATDTGLKQIVVTVKWTEKSVNRSYILTSYAYQ